MFNYSDCVSKIDIFDSRIIYNNVRSIGRKGENIFSFLVFCLLRECNKRISH